MDTSSFLMVVVTTVGSQEQARELARRMVLSRLSACAQISAIESFYVWGDEMQHDNEWRIVFKTTSQALPALQEAITQVHPYEVPAILSLRVDQANAAYLQWVNTQAQAGSSPGS
jgi:periplasmic divalent cation tolerance protein